MTGLKHARLRVILGENNTEKLTLPNGIPDSIDEFLSKWPEDFPVPRFSYDTELQLEKGNTEYQKSKKSPKRAEATFYPSFPVGETQESLEKVRLELLKEIQKRNNEGVIADKMARTFAYRRQEVVNQEPLVQDFMERWSALFREKEINAEFQRLVALPLEQAQLDKYSDQFIHIIQAKGGAK
ncbi:hypothetical protein L3Q82_016287, partial [Scortum barcoo]